ncbi:O-linked N-acetylglucosamine transferase, SPINDLY family protein [Azospirillum picis]|uniref:protein O-GlcNAc transferase n=1 Tax=Azospirillum picis TaxID=488438 RepID=A0ABU0MUQ8_9PROT|nr:tetratricopeptide repeat protein [Azospirillum picis]MBP2303080.1 putative O-linked N-acetylglucosamine transferase (SPINDLY family) [Azospirillum picis]MDQ0536806.1 putative O-linked N-acetylglucosamine transferase (SPINDLY family) [Azospirillum picis]
MTPQASNQGHSVAALLRRAVLAQQHQRMDEAAQALHAARAAFPHDGDVHFAIANFLVARKQPAAAIAQLRRTIAVEPGFARAYHNLAILLKKQGQLPSTSVMLARAVRLDPTLGGSLITLGDVRLTLGDRIGAQRVLERAALLQPGEARIWLLLGYLAKGQDEPERATVGFGRASVLTPSNSVARLGLCMSRLPILYDRAEDIEQARRHYASDLEALVSSVQLDDPAAVAAAAEAIGSFQPYYLAYQERCDRSLQEIYGRFVAGVMAARYPHWATRPSMSPRLPGQPLRVGIVSGFFRWHTIWKLMIRGWMGGLDPALIQLHGYYTGNVRDACTDQARARFYRFSEGLPFEEMAATIRAEDLHVLIYPEIGMDPMTAKLAALRLAPIQCVSWGHPDTTGLPTIDCVLSSDLMEPEGAESHYSERLIRLPGLGIAYEPLMVEAEPIDFTKFGVRSSATVYLCCQYVSKYLPQHDELLAYIARAVPNSQFLFINPRADGVTDRLRRRLKNVFNDHGLDAEHHIVFLPYLTPGQYTALNRRANVYLDSVGWSGGNTTLEAVSEGLPVVTLPGQLMRGQHSSAILRQIGVTETIANDRDHYVAIAVHLGTNRGWRDAIARRTRLGCQRIYEDMRPLRALENLLERF